MLKPRFLIPENLPIKAVPYNSSAMALRFCSVISLSFSGSYFSPFGLNTERYSVFLRIQFEFGKILTRKTLNSDTFHAVKVVKSDCDMIFKSNAIFAQSQWFRSLGTSSFREFRIQYILIIFWSIYSRSGSAFKMFQFKKCGISYGLSL